MIITLFSFGLSWAVFAFTFYLMTLVMPQFHSAYSQSTFSVAFAIGLIDTIFMKVLRMANIKVHFILLFLLGWGLNYVLIRGTSGVADTYYVTGHKAPLIVGFVMSLVMLLLEQGKARFFTGGRF